MPQQDGRHVVFDDPVEADLRIDFGIVVGSVADSLAAGTSSMV